MTHIITINLEDTSETALKAWAEYQAKIQVAEEKLLKARQINEDRRNQHPSKRTLFRPS